MNQKTQVKNLRWRARHDLIQYFEQATQFFQRAQLNPKDNIRLLISTSSGVQLETSLENALQLLEHEPNHPLVEALVNNYLDSGIDLKQWL